MSAKIPARGHTRKHTGTRKHHATGKHHPVHHRKTAAAHHGHHVHVAAKGAKPAKPRGFAVGDLLPVCSLEAVAMSLRLAGQFVDDDEVVALWEAAGAPALGASLAAALDTASLHGLAGLRPQRQRLEWFRPVDTADQVTLPVADDPAVHVDPFEHLVTGHALILGVDLPGPHAVLATPDGWWSWGRLWTPWTTAVSEAWEVSWS